MSAQECCASCRHFLPTTDAKADPPNLPDNSGRGFGSCRRYPPTADPVQRLVDSIDDLRYGGDEPGEPKRIEELGDTMLQSICIQLQHDDAAASVWPRVHQSDCCGEYLER